MDNKSGNDSTGIGRTLSIYIPVLARCRGVLAAGAVAAVITAVPGLTPATPTPTPAPEPVPPTLLSAPR